jgi:hypothetical protein
MNIRKSVTKYLLRAYQVLLPPHSVLVPLEKIIFALILLKVRFTAPYLFMCY